MRLGIPTTYSALLRLDGFRSQAGWISTRTTLQGLVPIKGASFQRSALNAIALGGLCALGVSMLPRWSWKEPMIQGASAYEAKSLTSS